MLLLLLQCYLLCMCARFGFFDTAAMLLLISRSWMSCFVWLYVTCASTLRNPWYSNFSSIYFSYTDSCSFFSGCSYPETPVIAPDTPDHKTRSIRAYTRSIRAESASDRFLSVFWVADWLFIPPSRHLKVLSSFVIPSGRASL